MQDILDLVAPTVEKAVRCVVPSVPKGRIEEIMARLYNLNHVVFLWAPTVTVYGWVGMDGVHVNLAAFGGAQAALRSAQAALRSAEAALRSAQATAQRSAQAAQRSAQAAARNAQLIENLRQRLRDMNVTADGGAAAAPTEDMEAAVAGTEAVAGDAQRAAFAATEDVAAAAGHVQHAAFVYAFVVANTVAHEFTHLAVRWALGDGNAHTPEVSRVEVPVSATAASEVAASSQPRYEESGELFEELAWGGFLCDVALLEAWPREHNAVAEILAQDGAAKRAFAASRQGLPVNPSRPQRSAMRVAPRWYR